MTQYDTGPYSDDFQPLFTAGDTAALAPLGVAGEVSAVEVFPGIQTQEITVAANDVEQDVEMTALNMDDGALGQYRLFNTGDTPQIPDGVEIEVAQGGQQQPRYGNKNEQGVLTSDTPDVGENALLTELFVWEDEAPFFTVRNTTGSEVTLTLTYSGFGYQLTPTDTDDPDHVVNVERVSLKR